MIDVVCGLIEDEGGQVLACLRPPGKHLGGKWEFPGGKVEAGENPEAALIRELQEELGIVIGIVASLTPVAWDYGKGPLRLIPFRCRITSGQPHPHEHAEIRWVGRETVTELDWADADGPILAQWQATA